MDITENSERDSVESADLFCAAEKCDNPPVRFGGHPTIFSWCSKEGARRAHQEAANANISSQNTRSV